MRFTAERLVADVTILDLASEQALGDMTTHIANRIGDLIGEGRRKFILSFDGVAYLDSSGLGDLAKAHKTATQQDAKLKLINVPPHVSTLLRTVKPSSVLRNRRVRSRSDSRLSVIAHASARLPIRVSGGR